MRVLPKWDKPFLITLIKNVSVYRGDKGKNPHKALLLICVLEKFKHTQVSSVSYKEIYKPLKELISLYSKSKVIHPDYPFWYLQNDHLFEVFYKAEPKFRTGKDFPPHAELLKCEVMGKLPFWIEKLLRKDPNTINQLQKIIAAEIINDSLESVLKNIYSVYFK
jgi:predicted restriction endonuclease